MVAVVGVAMPRYVVVMWFAARVQNIYQLKYSQYACISVLYFMLFDSTNTLSPRKYSSRLLFTFLLKIAHSMGVAVCAGHVTTHREVLKSNAC